MTEGKTIVEALSSVMEDVQAVRKGDRNAQQGFNFRGIDSVINAVGPAFRKHGVVAVPVGVEPTFDSYQSKAGALMRNCTVKITWRFYGPMGDHIEAMSLGEAADAGDKSVPKAHSVAYRILLLQALCIPTDEPDPDTYAHERATARPHSGRDWAAEANAAPTVDALANLWRQAVAAGEMNSDLADLITKLSDALKAPAEPSEAQQPALGGDDPWQTPAEATP